MACLSGDEMDMSHYMEKILQASGQKAPEVKRVLELNMAHPVMSKIKTLFENDRDNPVLTDYSHLLFDLALVAEGDKVQNPARFSRLVGELMAKGI